MGVVRLGVPEELALTLKETFGLSTFVETGTYKAGSTVWASNHFSRVVTIEGFEEYFRRAIAAHGHRQNVEFLFGDSRQKLPEVLRTLQEPAIFWLDAHWMGNKEISAGTDRECPLLDEIAYLMDSSIDHYILIDDARLFGEEHRDAPNREWPSSESSDRKSVV